MKKVLYIGFKGKNNSSFVLVDRINKNRYYLTNSFKGLKKDIDNLIICDSEAIMFGLDKTLFNKIRFDLYAEKNGEILKTNVDISKYVNKLEELNIDYCVSKRATKYLCNEAYYHMLNKNEGNAIFVHIPSIPHMDKDFLEKLVIIFSNERSI